MPGAWSFRVNYNRWPRAAIRGVAVIEGDARTARLIARIPELRSERGNGLHTEEPMGSVSVREGADGGCAQLLPLTAAPPPCDSSPRKTHAKYKDKTISPRCSALPG